MTRRLSWLLIAGVLCAAGPAQALTILDFEGLPLTHYYFSGNTNLGSYYAGVTFGTDVTILDQVIGGYNSSGFPPHSGNAVAFSVSDPTIRVDFAIPALHVGVWYTSSSSFYLEAYDSSNTLLATTSGAANYGSNAFLSLDVSGIAYVKLHDSGNFFTIDDFQYEAVPEPGTLMLLGAGLAGLGARRRRR